MAAPVTGNTLRGAFGGAVAAAFAETFGETPPEAAGGRAGGASQEASPREAEGPDMNTVVEVGPPASLRAQAAQGLGATQPGPKPAPVRGGKTQIWLGGGLPPSAGARPVASAGSAPDEQPAPSAGPSAASFQTDVAFPDAAPASRQRAPAPGAASQEGPTPMKTTVGFPPAGQSLLAAAEAARAAADAARATEASPRAAPAPASTPQPATPGPPGGPAPTAAPAPAAASPPPAASPAVASAPPTRPKPPPDFRQAAEHGFTRQGRDAPKGAGGVPVWVWVAGGVALGAVILALVLAT